MRIARVLVLLAALLPSAVLAQGALLQAGPTAPGRVPMYTSSGTQQPVVQDSGPASGGASGVGLSELGLTVRAPGTPPFANAGKGPLGTNLCDYDAPTTNPTGYHYVCLSPNAQGGGLLAFGSGGIAAPLPFHFSVNGVDQVFSLNPTIAPAHQFARGIDSSGTLIYAQPAFSDLSGQISQLQLPTGSTINPTAAPYSAVGDGITDDTAAWKAVCAQVQADGGGAVVSPAGLNYSIYASGQAYSHLCTLQNLSGVSIDMNGSVFSNHFVFPPSTGSTVTAITTGLAGVCRLTLSGGTAGYVTGITASLSGVVGATECDGSHTITVINSTQVDFSGTTYGNDYVSGGLLGQSVQQVMFLMLHDYYVWLKDISVTQVNPTVVPISFFDGTIGIGVATGGGEYHVFNPVLSNGIAPIEVNGNATDSLLASTYNITISGCQSQNSVYGMLFANNGNNVVASCQVIGGERSYYAYGMRNHDIAVQSQNPFASDVLIASSFNEVNVSNVVAGTGGACLLTVNSTTGYNTGDTVQVYDITGSTECNSPSNGWANVTVTASPPTILLTGSTFVNPYASGGNATDVTTLRPTENINLNYSVVKRSNGFQNDSNLSFDVGGPGSFSGGEPYGVIRHVTADLDLDLSGESAMSGPGIQVVKGSVAQLHSTLADVTVKGTIRVDSALPQVVDWNVASQAPWSGESQVNVSFAGFHVFGSSAPVFRMDFAAFPATTPGTLSMTDVSSTGPFTQVNTSQLATQLSARNVQFSNFSAGGVFPVGQNVGIGIVPLYPLHLSGSNVALSGTVFNSSNALQFSPPSDSSAVVTAGSVALNFSSTSAATGTLTAASAQAENVTTGHPSLLQGGAYSTVNASSGIINRAVGVTGTTTSQSIGTVTLGIGGSFAATNLSTSASSQVMQGLIATATQGAASTLTAAAAANEVISIGGSGTVTTSYGNEVVATVASGATGTTIYGDYISLVNNGTVGTWKGVYIPAASGGGTTTTKCPICVDDIAKNALAGSLVIGSGSPSASVLAQGELALAKESASGSAPGAGFLKIEVVAGTAGGSCKIIAYAGTSTTPVTVVDSVGGGC